MKKKTIRTNKKKLRKYSFGKPLAKTGYESADTVDTSLLSETPGYGGLKNDAQQLNDRLLPSVIAGNISTGLSSVSNALINTVSQSAANAANAAAAGISAEQAAALVKNLGEKEAAEALAAAATNNGAKAVTAGTLNTIGKVTSYAQMAKGAFDTVKGVGDLANSALSQDQVDATRSTGTNVRHGVAYNTISGPDADGVRAYGEAAQDAAKEALNDASASIGAGVGTVVGSTVLPGIGTVLGPLVGQGVGWLTGELANSSAGKWLVPGLGHIFSWASNKAKEEQERRIRSAYFRAEQQTAQNESVAGTQGLRNEYYATHRAALGKNPGERWSAGDYTGIQTPSGQTYGAIQGLAQPAEGEVDMLTGETHYNGSPDPNVKDSKKDIVPVGSANGDGEYFDMFVGIPGKQFADAARPYFKANEMIKMSSQDIDKELQANADHKHRDEATKKYIQNRLEKKQQMLQQQYQQNSQYIQDLVRQQSAMTTGKRYSCGKTPRFEEGLVPALTGYDRSLFQPVPLDNPYQYQPIVPPTEIKPITIKYPETKNSGLEYDQVRNNVGLPAWAGIAQALPYLIRTSNNAYGFQPHAENPYVANPYAGQAIRMLGELGYDNSQDKRALTSAVRQQLYNINRAGNLSAGQKAALANNLQIKAAASRAALNQEMYNKNAAYKQATAQALLSSGEAQATRAQQALAAQQEAYRKAVGAKQHLIAQADKNWYTVGRQAIQDYSTQDMYSRMLDLYNLRMYPKGYPEGFKPRTDL